ncbi:MAG: site-2 protease family protein [Chlamydiales bacterium]
MTGLYFIFAALALGILVFIHELGHYFVAKKVGMIVEVFSIGFGRPLLKWKWNGVNWQLGWLPFGGYVKIAGMEFSKKDKQTYNEPYDIPNGFFAKAPWRRIMVAVAGPFSNFILAFLLFFAVWAMGGREKPFSDFTQIVGWVDPHSELYAMGVRPGDIINEYNNKPLTSSKDLLYAAILGDKTINLKGYHVDYINKEQTPFDYTIETYPSPDALDSISTTGVSSWTRYLIYDHLPDGTPYPLPEASPMEESGIEYGQQLVWANGELLFSMEQLSYILNGDQTLLTVQREGKTFLTRQPRVLVTDLILPAYVRNEVIDWQYEAGIKGRWQDLWVLPYIVNSEGYIEGPLNFIDKESRVEAFPLYPYSKDLERPLAAQDRILAVDGIPVSKGHTLLDLLQTRRVQLIVKKNVPVSTKTSWKKEDKVFLNSIHWQEIESIARTIGTPHLLRETENYALLNPVTPKRMDQFTLAPETQEKIKRQFERQRAEAEAIRDQTKRQRALQYLDQSQQKLILGIYLQDRLVDYNPSPVTLFSEICGDTWRTLKALVTGSLHPKWLSGPIGIVQVIQHGWKVGIGEALFWIGAISLNLGILNILPIPVLDGGYICLSLWEIVTRRRLKAKTMERLIIPFVVLLIALLVFLTFQDIGRLF